MSPCRPSSPYYLAKGESWQEIRESGYSFSQLLLKRSLQTALSSRDRHCSSEDGAFHPGFGHCFVPLAKVGTMRPRFWVPDLSFMVPSLPLSLISLFVNKCSYFEYAICFPMGPWLIQPQTRFHHQTLHAAMFHHQTGKSTIFQGNKRTHAFIKPVGSVQSPFSLQWCSISVRTQQDLTILCLPRLQIMWFCHCLPKTRQSQEWHPHKGSDWSLQWTFYRKAGGRDEHTNSTEIAWSFTAIISLTCFSESWFAGRTFAWPDRHL